MFTYAFILTGTLSRISCKKAQCIQIYIGAMYFHNCNKTHMQRKRMKDKFSPQEKFK